MRDWLSQVLAPWGLFLIRLTGPYALFVHRDEWYQEWVDRHCKGLSDLNKCGHGGSCLERWKVKTTGWRTVGKGAELTVNTGRVAHIEPVKEQTFNHVATFVASLSLPQKPRAAQNARSCPSMSWTAIVELRCGACRCDTSHGRVCKCSQSPRQ